MNKRFGGFTVTTYLERLYGGLWVTTYLELSKIWWRGRRWSVSGHIVSRVN